MNLQGELEAAVPLAESIEQFWRSPSLDQLPPRMPAQHIPHALLRRLGASPMDGKFPLSGLLETIYDQVGEASRAMLEDDPD